MLATSSTVLGISLAAGIPRQEAHMYRKVIGISFVMMAFDIFLMPTAIMMCARMLCVDFDKAHT